jgi:hypothetical protein
MTTIQAGAVIVAQFHLTWVFLICQILGPDSGSLNITLFGL